MTLIRLFYFKWFHSILESFGLLSCFKVLLQFCFSDLTLFSITFWYTADVKMDCMMLSYLVPVAESHTMTFLSLNATLGLCQTCPLFWCSDNWVLDSSVQRILFQKSRLFSCCRKTFIWPLYYSQSKGFWPRLNFSSFFVICIMPMI